MKCSKCNNIIPDDSSFCNHCGNKIEKEPQPDLNHTSQPDNIAQNTSLSVKDPIYKTWGFWVIMIVVFLGLISAFSEGDVAESTTTTPTTTTTQKGTVGASQSNPYILNADTWYTEHCKGTSKTKYLDKWVKVTGTVLNISDYGNLKGYYLVGGTGKGLVCWVDNGNYSANYGQIIEFVGKVTVADSNHIEISDGSITSVKWPTQKPISPITISDWSWTRDYVGGVEWNWKFTNNTDKTVKYITMEWACYNAVGDLVYDEITGKSKHSVKYTGPLEAGQTTILLRNTTLFYSYSYQSAQLTKLEVEFMDGTIIKITSQGYSDIIID